jgi:hypothetical protein
MNDSVHEFYWSLFVTAIEGGINYWADVVKYHCADTDDDEGHQGFYAVIREDGLLEGPQTLRIDLAVIKRGFRLASTKFRHLGWSAEKPPIIVRPDMDWDADAGDADMVVQLGLFGDVIYS